VLAINGGAGGWEGGRQFFFHRQGLNRFLSVKAYGEKHI